MNTPTQSTWAEIEPGDIVSPSADGPWYRVTGKAGATFDLHGPITVQDLTAGEPKPNAQPDLSSPVWTISTEVTR